MPTDYNFLFFKNEKITESEIQKRSKSVSLHNKQLQEKLNNQKQQLKSNKNDCLPVSLTSQSQDFQRQKQKITKIPNALAASGGLHEQLLQTLIQNGRQLQQSKSIRLTGVHNVDLMSKISSYSSKLVRPYCEQVQRAQKVLDRAETIASRINMTTTLKDKVKNTFHVFCLINAKEIQLRPEYEKITTQFGLSKQLSMLHKQTLALFSNSYYYFRGGSISDCEEFSALKVMQRHHQYSKQQIQFQPNMEFFVDLINNQKISLYSLEEELGVSRILCYSAVCGLCGLVPQTYDYNCNLTDTVEMNFILWMKSFNTQTITIKQTQTSLSQSINSEYRYIQKPTKRSILNEADAPSEPEAEDINSNLAEQVLNWKKQDQKLKAVNKKMLFDRSCSDSGIKNAILLANGAKLEFHTLQDAQFIQQYKRRHFKDQNQYNNYQNNNYQNNYNQNNYNQNQNNYNQNKVNEHQKMSFKTSNCLQNVQGKNRIFIQTQPQKFNERYEIPKYVQQQYNVEHEPETKQFEAINQQKTQQQTYKQVQVQLKQNVYEGLKCQPENVRELTDFEDFSEYVIGETRVNNLIDELGSYKKEQQLIVDDLITVNNKVNLDEVVGVFNRIRKCDIKAQQLNEIDVIQLMRRILINAMKKELCFKLALKSKSSIGLESVIDIYLLMPELKAQLSKKTYSILINGIIQMEKQNNNDTLSVLDCMKSILSPKKQQNNVALRNEPSCIKLVTHQPIPQTIEQQQQYINKQHTQQQVLEQQSAKNLKEFTQMLPNDNKLTADDLSQANNCENPVIKLFNNQPRKKIISIEWKTIYINMIKAEELLKNDQDKIRGYLSSVDSTKVEEFYQLVIDELQSTEFSEVYQFQKEIVILSFSLWINGFRLFDFSDGKVIDENNIDLKLYDIAQKSKTSYYQTSKYAIVDLNNNIIAKQCLIGTERPKFENDVKPKIKKQALEVQKEKDFSVQDARNCEPKNCKIWGKDFKSKYESQPVKKAVTETQQKMIQYQQDIHRILEADASKNRLFLAELNDEDVLKFYQKILKQINQELESAVYECEILVIIVFSTWFNGYKLADFTNGQVIQEPKDQSKFQIAQKSKTGFFQTSRFAIVDENNTVIILQQVIGVTTKTKPQSLDELPINKFEQAEMNIKQQFAAEAQEQKQQPKQKQVPISMNELPVCGFDEEAKDVKPTQFNDDSQIQNPKQNSKAQNQQQQISKDQNKVQNNQKQGSKQNEANVEPIKQIKQNSQASNALNERSKLQTNVQNNLQKDSNQSVEQTLLKVKKNDVEVTMEGSFKKMMEQPTNIGSVGLFKGISKLKPIEELLKCKPEDAKCISDFSDWSGKIVNEDHVKQVMQKIEGFADKQDVLCQAIDKVYKQITMQTLIEVLNAQCHTNVNHKLLTIVKCKDLMRRCFTQELVCALATKLNVSIKEIKNVDILEIYMLIPEWIDEIDMEKFQELYDFVQKYKK